MKTLTKRVLSVLRSFRRWAGGWTQVIVLETACLAGAGLEE